MNKEEEKSNLEFEAHKDISIVSMSDKLVGLSGILTSILLPAIVLLILGLVFKDKIPSSSEKLIYGIGIVVLIVYFPFFVATTKKLILNTFKSIGRGLWLRKHNDGYPIDENNKYYKYVENMSILRDPNNIIIQNQENVDAIKKSTYLNNMLVKQRSYSNKLKKLSSKTLKKLNRQKNKKTIDEVLINELESKYNSIMIFLEKTNSMYDAINRYDYEEVGKFDSELYDEIKIQYNEINYEEIIHKTFDNNDESDIVERFLTHPTVRKVRLYGMSVITFAALGYFLLYHGFDKFDLNKEALGYVIGILLILGSKTKNIFTDAVIEFNDSVKLSIRYIDILENYKIILSKNIKIKKVQEPLEEIKSEETAD